MNIKENVKNTLKRFTKDNDYQIYGKELFCHIVGKELIDADHQFSPEEFIKIFKRKDSKTSSQENIQELFTKNIEKIHISQQLTEENIRELAISKDLSNGQSNKGLINSFLFLTVRMKPSSASNKKSIYAKITRIINRSLGAPAVILFCCQQKNEQKISKKNEHSISLSFMHHRQHKIIKELDVVGKVSMLHNINCNYPHRAHLEIIADLYLPTCIKKISMDNLNFDGIMEEWLDILDIDKLNKKFYDELYHWFDRVKNSTETKFPSAYKIKTFGDNGELQIEDKNEKKESQIIRLITRFMFIWFMKEKGLIPSKLFDEEQVDKILKNFNKIKGDNYYLAILQNLFFGTLNTPLKDEKGKNNRKFSSKSQQGHRVFTSWRHETMIKHPQEFKSIMNKIPFINGGLFECLDSNEASKDEAGYRLDCFSDIPNQRKDLLIPNHIFFSKNGRDGLIDIFNRYKFTVEENTPLDVDVALDPELLGKVFENLLAAYNPETKETARKSSGSYYTPRHIVDYMVTNALKEYLKNYLTQKHDSHKNIQNNLDILFNLESTYKTFNTAYTDIIIKAISNIKVLDPAVGSGAFPMEVLRTCVELLEKLDPDNEKWKEQQLSKIPERKSLIKDYEVSAEISNEKARVKAQEELAERQQEITNNFNKLNHNYLRKLYLIRNNIYGVDIQPIACQIAKLRFFISLIIEQQPHYKDGGDNNFGIQPLPNLETNFICTDSLIKLYKPEMEELDMIDINRYQNELKHNRDRFFLANTRKKKHVLVKEDAEIRNNLRKSLETYHDRLINNQNSLQSKKQYKLQSIKRMVIIKENIKKIASWDITEQLTTADWFDAEWMFGIQDGFDLVIGNPPYRDFKNMSRADKDYRNTIKNNYEVCVGRWDIYIAFFDRGMNILNKNGSLCFITPNKWINTDYGEKLRIKYLKNINDIVDIKRLGFSTANVDTLVTTITKNECEKIQIKEYSKNYFTDGIYISKNFLKQPYRLDIFFSNHIKFIKKIEQKFTTILSSIAKCEQACWVDEYYKIQKIVKDATNNNIESGDNSYFKLINTGTIGIYKSNWGIKAISFKKINFLCPAVDKKEFQSVASNAYIKLSEKPKIIIKGINNMKRSNSLMGCIDENMEYLPGLGTLVVTSDALEDLLYLSAIINSKFASFYTREKNIKSNLNKDLVFKYYMINTIPLPNIARGSKPYKILIDLVREILSHKLSNLEKQKIQEKIDKYLYELYELTPLEINTINESFKK